MNKKSLKLTSILLLFVSTAWCQTDASQYLHIIGDQFQKISNEMMSYSSAVNHGKSARKVERRRVDLVEQIKESEKIVRRLKPFNGKSTLRDSISAYFRISQILLNEDYAKIINLEDIAEQSYDAMEAYLLAKEKANEKGDQAGDAAQHQYEAFAAENNIKLIDSDSELSKKLEKTSEVIGYSNKIYLLFFRSYKNENYMMEAMAKDDVTKLEQVKNALASSAKEDLGKARQVTAFNGDASLKGALLQTLNFYTLEAEKMDSYMQFVLTKDNMEKVKKSFDATPASKRTKEQVDAYNKNINDFNRQVNAVNAMNEDMNKRRSTALKSWNETYDNFLDKHTPKHK
jgi:hypothetical protein